MPELRNATVKIGVPGLNGGGVTSGELATAVADRAPAAGSYFTKSAEADLSGETAMSSLGGPGILKIAADGTPSIAVGADLPTHTSTGVLVVAGFLVDGGGSVIASGIKGDLPVLPFSGTITGVAATADQTGSVAFQFWLRAMSSYPPTVADSLGTLTLSSQIRSPTSGTWTTVSWPFVAGDVMRINCSTGATSITRVTLSLLIERTV